MEYLKLKLYFKEMTQENLKTKFKRDIQRGDDQKRKRNSKEIQEPKKKKLKIKRKCDPDSECSDKDHIYEDGNLIYDVNLMQDGHGLNNYCIIQLIVTQGEWVVFSRWGEIGKKGSRTVSHHITKKNAIDDFKKQFKEKNIK